MQLRVKNDQAYILKEGEEMKQNRTKQHLIKFTHYFKFF